MESQKISVHNLNKNLAVTATDSYSPGLMQPVQKPTPLFISKNLKMKCCGIKLPKHHKCKCFEISRIQKVVRKWSNYARTMKQVVFRGDTISYKSIDSFNVTARSSNDSNNKKRENIICAIINRVIPEYYYIHSRRWKKLGHEVNVFLEIMCKTRGISIIDNVVCFPKAGRGNHYDFKLVVNGGEVFMVEFKFNASCVDDTPQFVSPMKPSQYLETSYESYYYDTHFIDLTSEFELPLPDKDDYMKQIHSTKPQCLKTHQEIYYKGCRTSSKYSGNACDINFYESSKKHAYDSIRDFISMYDLNKEKLSHYLLESQENKYYMLYKVSSLYMETINLDDYMITSVIKEPEKNRFIAETKSGKKLTILLRWKNGNGIAFPSFQIS
jgi:hypothetical protein